MKNIFLNLLTFLFFTMNVNAQAQKKANKDTNEWRYQIEAVSTGVDGTYMIKVWSYSKKSDIAIEQSQKNAVHGIIFKGFGGIPGVPGQKPLSTNPNLFDEHFDFFDAFFADGGKYKKFVSLTTDGAIDAEDRKKVGKEYKIGVVVTVLKDALRADLESAGILKGLSSGF